MITARICRSLSSAVPDGSRRNSPGTRKVKSRRSSSRKSSDTSEEREQREISPGVENPSGAVGIVYAGGWYDRAGGDTSEGLCSAAIAVPANIIDAGRIAAQRSNITDGTRRLIASIVAHAGTL